MLAPCLVLLPIERVSARELKSGPLEVTYTGPARLSSMLPLMVTDLSIKVVAISGAGF